MKSFRSEIENPVVEKDIVELEKKIRLFKTGQLDEDSFRSLRLARGIYGQRQLGVQMIRIKLPFGRVNSRQLHRIADVSDRYSTGRLHITTRQDIQIHHVSLDQTPELWAELEKDDITLREACGNAVRNVTASPMAGVDPEEPFDVTPYAEAVFKFFLRNPVCQEMGRKFKIAFSGSDADSALTFIHDLGFIAKTKQIDGKVENGFKVMIAGGLGAQPRAADIASEFLPTAQLIPFIEGVLRVYDRYGERKRRAKARLKFLIKSLGLPTFLELVDQERLALSRQTMEIETDTRQKLQPKPIAESIEVKGFDDENTDYRNWLSTNVFKQKQSGYSAIGIKVSLGDFYTDKARLLADLIRDYAGDEIRFTLRQNILIRNVKTELLPFFYTRLKALEFVDPGVESVHDITACPGTDTCSLGIASSTGIATELEKVLRENYQDFITQKDLNIKISGCMNACGQHSISDIGFQGMSIKVKDKIAPALQILLGGKVMGNGEGQFSDKVVKVPSKRGPRALVVLLEDFKLNGHDDTFHAYYIRQGKSYFYELLKPLTDLTTLSADDFVDWGHNSEYIKAIGIGECAGVAIDLVTTLFFESEEKFEWAQTALDASNWSDSIYHIYTGLVNMAKALLISENKTTNTQIEIIKSFDMHFIETGQIEWKTSFTELALSLKKIPASQHFAKQYLDDARSLYQLVNQYRLKQIRHENRN